MLQTIFDVMKKGKTHIGIKIKNDNKTPDMKNAIARMMKILL